MGRKLLKTVQIITTFRNPLADPMGTRRGPPLVRGPQFENRCCSGITTEVEGRIYKKFEKYVAYGIWITISSGYSL